MNRYKTEIIKRAITIAIEEAEADTYEDFIDAIVLILKHHHYRFTHADVEQVVEAMEENKDINLRPIC